jgi:AcrR family transcriptional regulator
VAVAKGNRSDNRADNRGDNRGDAGDRRVRRTQAALRGALIELIEERELSRITVADVAERAGVSRTAFYDHFRDVHELAEAACTTMIDDLLTSMPATPAAAALDKGRQLLEPFFANLAQYAGLYRSVLGQHGSARVIDHIRRRTTVAAYFGAREAAAGENAEAPATHPATYPAAYPTDIPHDVPAAFTAGALIGVAIDWLQRGCPRTPAEMAELTWPLFTALYHADTAASA